jgi:hypothetical protein
MSAALQIAAMSISLPLFVSGNELAVYARDFLRPLFGGGFWRSEKAKAISAAFDRRASLPQAALKFTPINPDVLLLWRRLFMPFCDLVAARSSEMRLSSLTPCLWSTPPGLHSP